MALAHGVPSTWDGYQRMVGEHQGLQATLTMIDEMLDDEKNRD